MKRTPSGGSSVIEKASSFVQQPGVFDTFGASRSLQSRAADLVHEARNRSAKAHSRNGYLRIVPRILLVHDIDDYLLRMRNPVKGTKRIAKFLQKEFGDSEHLMDGVIDFLVEKPRGGRMKMILLMDEDSVMEDGGDVIFVACQAMIEEKHVGMAKAFSEKRSRLSGLFESELDLEDWLMPLDTGLFGMLPSLRGRPRNWLPDRLAQAMYWHLLSGARDWNDGVVHPMHSRSSRNRNILSKIAGNPSMADISDFVYKLASDVLFEIEMDAVESVALWI